MNNILQNLPEGDPLTRPEKKMIIDEIIDGHRKTLGATMVVLNEVQSRIGFLSEAMQVYIARRLHVPVSKVHGVVTFYSFFTTTPRGKHCLKFCLGTACYVGGAPQLIEKAKQILGVEPGQTTKDGNVTIEVCRCVGACSQAPMVVLDEELYGRVRPNKIPQILHKIEG